MVKTLLSRNDRVSELLDAETKISRRLGDLFEQTANITNDHQARATLTLAAAVLLAGERIAGEIDDSDAALEDTLNAGLERIGRAVNGLDMSLQDLGRYLP